MKEFYDKIESNLGLKLTERERIIINYILNIDSNNGQDEIKTIVKTIRINGGLDLRDYRLIEKLSNTFNVECDIDYVGLELGFLSRTNVYRFTMTGKMCDIEKVLKEV